MSEATGRQKPDPETIRDADGLVVALRQLRTWAGEPSLRRLTALAGQRHLPDGRLVDALPSSTLSDNLGGRRLPRLPRRSFISAFVTACLRARRCPDEEIAAEVRHWRQALRRIAASEPMPGAPTPPPAMFGTAVPATDSASRSAEAPPASGEASLAGQVQPTGRAAEAAHPVGATGHDAAGGFAPTWTATPVRTLRQMRSSMSRTGRRTRVVTAVTGLVVLLAVVGLVVNGAGDDDTSRAAPPAGTPSGSPSPTTAAPSVPPSQTPPARQPAGQQRPPDQAKPGATSKRPANAPRGLPAAGWYNVQPGHTRHLGYCWGEGRERNGNTNRPLVVQRSCGDGVRTKFVSLGGGVYRLEWHSPQFGIGCISVDYGNQATAPGALLAPRSCDYGGNRFRLEPYGGGYRLRPVHSGLCIGSLYGAADTDPGAEAIQVRCTGAADQWFSLR